MKRFAVTGIGNAIVDVISPMDDGLITQLGVEKGIMQLVDQTRAQKLYENMTTRQQSPGGSVANTIAGIGALGISTALISKVSNDELGNFYATSMSDSGTFFANAPIHDQSLSTSYSMIFVSPDGERSMNTYLGISTELGPDDISTDIITQSDILFLEGYLYDKPKGKQAFEHAAKICRESGGKAGITLSDPFCVDRHRDDFRRLIKNMDYVIGNEHEWASLYQTDLSKALKEARRDTGLIVCTRSSSDVIIIQGDDRITVPITPITPVDATGAGDQFAAGFIYGMATQKSLKVSAHMGCIAAAEVITHYGARPQKNIADLWRKEGLI